MILPYTRFKLKDGFATRPFINVVLINGARRISTAALLDTGSDNTLINKQFGKQLGIDFTNCEESQATGIGGVTKKTWVAQIDIEVENLLNSRRTVNVQFIDSPTVGVLLGHVGFFENFVVRFDSSVGTLEIT